MTRQLAYQHEPVGDLTGTPTMTDYLALGANPTVEDVSLQNSLQRNRYPDDPQAVSAIEQTFEGAVSVSWDLTESWWLNHHFGTEPTAGGETAAPYTYTWTYTDYLVQSARLFVGLQTGASAYAERVLKGVVFPQLDVSLTEGGPVRISATGWYADEESNTALTPGAIVGKDATPMQFHGGSISIPATNTIAKPREATLSLDAGTRPQRDMTRKPVDAVVGPVETTLTLQDVVTNTDQLTLAYGNSTAPATPVGGVSGAADGELYFSAGANQELTFDMTGVTPNTYNWANVADWDADTLEDTEFFVDQVQATAASDEASAL